MSTTNYNWTYEHPRYAVDIDGDGRADLVGIGPDGVWSCLSRSVGGRVRRPPGRLTDREVATIPRVGTALPPTLAFSEPAFALVGFEANAGWRRGDHPRFLVDLNGDHRVDILGFGDQGAWTSLGDGAGGFGTARLVLQELGLNQGWTAEHPRFLGDLTGDGRPDVIGFGKDGIWVALSNGDGTFQPAVLVFADLAFNSGWRVDKHPRFIADLTRDRRGDIVGFGDDGVWTALGNGDGSFQGARFVLNELGFNQGWRVDRHPRFLADLAGNGTASLVGFGDGGVWVAVGNGDGSFQAARFVLAEFGFNQGWRVDKHPRFLADLTGDGRADIVGFGDGGVWVALGNGDGSFRPAQFVLADLGFNQGWQVEDHPRLLADMHGDGKPDLVGFGDAGVWVARGRGDGTFEAPGFLLADFGRRSNPDNVVRKEVVDDHRQRGRIKHIFVLMIENRSYDHMLGFAELSGVDAATGTPTAADGLTGREFNTHQGVKYNVSRGAPDVTVAPGHEFGDALEQLCGHYARYPNGGPYPEVNNTGFVSSIVRHGHAERPGNIMQCFNPDHVRILTTLAAEFAVCDRWFCSMPGPTEPNRYFLHAASSDDYDESPSPAKLFESSTNHWGGIDFKGGNIFAALDDAGIKARIYAGDRFPVVGELEGVSNTFDVKNFKDFTGDLKDANFDYGFIHIEPKYFDGVGDTTSHNFGNGNSQHPSGGVAAGERLIKATYEAIRNSPHWESSMLIITYDEHGGFYDHVAPGPAAPTGSKGSEHGFMFDQLGPRVPAVVISPLIPKHTIEHRLLEHCSVIKSACDLFGVPHLQHARDLRGICGLLHLAQLSEPRTDTPAMLPDVVVSDIPPDDRSIAFGPEQTRSLGNPSDNMIAMTVRVAAIREMAFEPERRNEIIERVSRISTFGEAVAYVKEVEAKLEHREPA